MSDELSCEQVQELSAELALGIAGGHERDAVLRHLDGCAECRETVAELALVADDLLLLAPSREPSPGFAERTLARLEVAREQGGAVPAGRRHRPRWVGPLTVAAAIAIAAALGAGAALQVTAQERALGDSYRDLLFGGNGSFFAVAPLMDADGRSGTAWRYQGQPSWVFVSMPTIGPGGGAFEITVVTDDGRVIPAGKALLGAGGTWGGAMPVALGSIRELRMQRDGLTLVATFDARSPWI